MHERWSRWLSGVCWRPRCSPRGRPCRRAPRRPASRCGDPRAAPPRRRPTPGSKTVRDQADHGGWLVVRGTQVGDQTVAALTRATLSHAVVFDKQKEEVIEAVAVGGPGDAAARAARAGAPPADHPSPRVDARRRGGGRRPRARTRRAQIRLAGAGRRAERQALLLHRAGGRLLPRARGGLEAGRGDLSGRHGDDRNADVRFGPARSGERARATFRAAAARRARRRLRGGGRARPVPWRASRTRTASRG